MSETHKSSEQNTKAHIIQHNDSVSEFRLEHYKYILQEIHSLNNNLNKYLALFQTLATVIIGGGISIFASWRSLKIGANTARAGIQGLLGLLILLTLFITVSIVANVLSWFDYRKEEVELLDQVVKPNYRRPPTLRNFWRWSETYVLLFIIVVVVAVVVAQLRRMAQSG